MSAFVQELGHDGLALQSALGHLMPGQVQGVVDLFGHSGTDSVASTPEFIAATGP